MDGKKDRNKTSNIVFTHSCISTDILKIKLYGDIRTPVETKEWVKMIFPVLFRFIPTTATILELHFCYLDYIQILFLMLLSHLVSEKQKQNKMRICINLLVLLGGIRGGQPIDPKAYFGATRILASSDFFIVATATSQPKITSPTVHNTHA